MQPDVPSWQTSTADTAARPRAVEGTRYAWLAETHVILWLIGLYLVGHCALRLALGPTLGLDDAEQILFAQRWDFGYRFRQPPLFTWLLLPIIDIVGPGVLAVSLVRYLLLAITFVCLYLTARLCLDDQRFSGLAVLSYALIYVFAYYAHHDLTHTTALGAAIALAFHVTARLAKNPSLPAYGLLGLVFGFGLLAKWNFALLAIGLPLTCLLLPSYRHLVLTRKIALTIAIMAAISTPTALWMFAHDQSVQAVSSDILTDEAAIGGLSLWLEGGSTLLRSTLLFPLPFLPIFLVLFGQSLRFRRAQLPTTFRPALTPTFFGFLMLIMLGLHVLLIPLFGAVNFTERWMHPALMPLPIFLFALAERGERPERRIAGYLAVTAILVAAAIGARLYRSVEGADHCGKCREFAPFAELAGGLRQAGFAQGTIVADGLHIGGNLRMLFAGSLVVDPAFPPALWPDGKSADGSVDCLLVWRDDADRTRERRDGVRQYARVEFGLSTTAIPKTGRLDAALLGSSSRRYALGFELYREKDGGCR
ncbi:MAG: glycosyltransferase family 39 protein [Geminicoccaceae bacterium]